MRVNIIATRKAFVSLCSNVWPVFDLLNAASGDWCVKKEQISRGSENHDRSRKYNHNRSISSHKLYVAVQAVVRKQLIQAACARQLLLFWLLPTHTPLDLVGKGAFGALQRLIAMRALRVHPDVDLLCPI